MATAFDPAADPIVSQTVQGVTANNLKSFGHFMDLIVQESAKDLLAEGRSGRSLSSQASYALGARVVESILGREVEDAVTDSIEGDTGLASGQVGAKIAQTTPPESTSALVIALSQMTAGFQQAQAQQNQALLAGLQQIAGMLGSAPAGK